MDRVKIKACFDELFSQTTHPHYLLLDAICSELNNEVEEDVEGKDFYPYCKTFREFFKDEMTSKQLELFTDKIFSKQLTQMQWTSLWEKGHQNGIKKDTAIKFFLFSVSIYQSLIAKYSLGEHLKKYIQYCEKNDESPPSLDKPQYRDIWLDILNDEEQLSPKKCSLLETLITTPIYIDTEDEGVSLSPLNHTSKLHGREEEIQRLDDLLESDESPFQLMFVIGPSGAGKTRLATQWFRENIDHETWQAGFITDDTKLEEWKVWEERQLTCDTLIVVDYIYRFKNVVRCITQKGLRHINYTDNMCRKNTSDEAFTKRPIRLRLIILDHVLPDQASFLTLDIHKKEAFGLEQGKVNAHLQRMHKNHPPLYLKQSKQMLTALIDDASGNMQSEQNIEKAYETLTRIDIRTKNEEATNIEGETGFAHHPLFAILIGQALKNKPIEEIEYWQRSDLIGHYFTDNRLPWDKNNGQLIGAAIAAATALQGIKYDAVFDAFLTFNIDFDGRNKASFIDTCNYLISSYNKNTLEKFQPDILGQTFVLLFYENFKCTSPKRQGSEYDTAGIFFFLLSSSCENKTEGLRVNNRFIEFVCNTVRNLLNEDQSSIYIKNMWSCLKSILLTKNFTCNGMKLTVIIAALETINLLKANHRSIFSAYAQDFLKSIDYDFLMSSSIDYLRDNNLDDFERIDIIDQLISAVANYTDLLIELALLSQNQIQLLKELIKTHENCSSDNRFFIPSEYDTPYLLDWMLRHDKRGINNRNMSGKTPLIDAIFHQSETVIEKLLSLKRDKKDGISLTGIYLYVISKALSLFGKGWNHEFLVNVNCLSGHGSNALRLACAYGSTNVVSSFLKRPDVKLNYQDRDGKTALMEGCSYGKQHSVSLLLEREGINFNLLDADGKSALMHACEVGNSDIVYRLLQRKDVDVNIQCNEGETALMKACAHGNAEIVDHFLTRKDVLLNLQDKNGYSALMIACRRGQRLEVVKSLVERGNGIDFNLKSTDNENALMIACYRGGVEILKFLLASDADLECNIQSDDGKTALILACEYGDSETVKCLLESHLDIEKNTRCNSGLTPLSISCRCGDIKKVEALLLTGKEIDVNFRAAHQNTAIITACMTGHLSIVKCLIENSKDIDLNLQNDLGFTPLMCACSRGYTEIADYIMNCDKPVDLDIKNFRDLNALEVAKFFRKHKTYKHLSNQIKTAKFKK